jgi:hypothetical protein
MKILLRFSFLWLYIEYLKKHQFFPEEIYKIVNEYVSLSRKWIDSFTMPKNAYSGILLPIIANF